MLPKTWLPRYPEQDLSVAEIPKVCSRQNCARSASNGMQKTTDGEGRCLLSRSTWEFVSVVLELEGAGLLLYLKDEPGHL